MRHEELGASGAAATAVFRIVQEALTNVARHAQATRVHVESRAPPAMCWRASPMMVAASAMTIIPRRVRSGCPACASAPACWAAVFPFVALVEALSGIAHVVSRDRKYGGREARAHK